MSEKNELRIVKITGLVYLILCLIATFMMISSIVQEDVVTGQNVKVECFEGLVKSLGNRTWCQIVDADINK